MVVPGAGGGGNGRCLVGTESQVSKMKRVLEMMVVMVVNVLNTAELHSKLVKMAHVMLQTFHHNFFKKRSIEAKRFENCFSKPRIV